MIPRAAIHLFNQLQYLNVEFSIRVSFVEIYNEEIRDLLVSDSPPLKYFLNNKITQFDEIVLGFMTIRIIKARLGLKELLKCQQLM